MEHTLGSVRHQGKNCNDFTNFAKILPLAKKEKA
jgi:hypothetical protein